MAKRIRNGIDDIRFSYCKALCLRYPANKSSPPTPPNKTFIPESFANLQMFKTFNGAESACG